MCAFNRRNKKYEGEALFGFFLNRIKHDFIINFKSQFFILKSNVNFCTKITAFRIISCSMVIFYAMCLSGAKCLSADCCFSELPLWKSNWAVTLMQSGYPHHLIEN
jgi:hypothetical protein